MYTECGTKTEPFVTVVQKVQNISEDSLT